MARLLPFVLIASLVCAASAKVFESDHVLKLGQDFKERTSDGKVYFVKFFAPWCGTVLRTQPAVAITMALKSSSLRNMLAHDLSPLEAER